VNAIVDHIDSTGTIEGAPYLKDEHLAVFDCSFRPQNGERSIHYMGHVRMMAAVQPFISGAISKTINMPEECTVEEIMDAYLESWKLGLKAVAIYRDNSKRVQPMSSGTAKGAKPATGSAQVEEKIVERIVYQPVRRKLPDERQALTHKFAIGGHEGYLTVGLYEDGSAGRIVHHHGERRLDYFGPDGQLRDGGELRAAVWRAAEVFRRQVQSRAVRAERVDGESDGAVREVDHGLHFPVARARFLGPEYAVGEAGEAPKLRVTEPDPQQALPFSPATADAPTCSECGGIMTRNGSCYKCENCGGTSGCS
jgi:ribonucleoside-diphosphate reductase alpha chain